MNFRLFFSCLFGVLVSNAVGYVSSFATRSSVNTWYKYLNKPPFNPPDWIFMPVWILLYFLMGIAFGIFFSIVIKKNTKLRNIAFFYNFFLMACGPLFFWIKKHISWISYDINFISFYIFVLGI